MDIAAAAMLPEDVSVKGDCDVTGAGGEPKGKLGSAVAGVEKGPAVMAEDVICPGKPSGAPSTGPDGAGRVS